jgi:hypothetical protein
MRWEGERWEGFGKEMDWEEAGEVAKCVGSEVGTSL